MNNDSEYQDIGYLYLQNNNIPDQDTINGISPNYISNCPNPNFVINSSNPSCHVQDISNFNNTNKNITNVVNIYNSLFDLTLVSEGVKPEDGDEEEKAHLQEILKFGECIDNFIEKLTKQKEKSLKYLMKKHKRILIRSVILKILLLKLTQNIKILFHMS